MTASLSVPVATSLPPMTIGSSGRSFFICSSRSWRLARSGEPGAYSRTGSLCGGGGRKIPGALIDRHCIGVQVVEYQVDGWGVGELWLDAGVVVNHDLPRAAMSRGLTPEPVENELVARVHAYFCGDV